MTIFDLEEDDLYPDEQLISIGGVLCMLASTTYSRCLGCNEPLMPQDRGVADGCECNSPRGVNHGLVAKNTCTCRECDPEETGSSRVRP